jgi:5-dehydro-4-deoxyglucarate dehydratase
MQAFVCTPFTADDEIDLPRFRAHLRALFVDVPRRPAGCFVCCGTGELWSLDATEHRALVRAAVEEVGGLAPVIAGVGYGTRLAIALARAAEDEGADGILVFPPYLIASPQSGLYRHYHALASAVGIGVLVYHRDNAVFAVETIRRLAALPNLIGLKDGHGDLELLTQIRDAVDRPFVLGNGMPVAESYAPAYARIGVRSYSPGIIDFLPEVSWAFDQLLERGDEARVERLLEGFYRPLAALRSQTPGLGVALVKAGLKVRGAPAGGVRAPLVDATAAQVAELERLIEQGLALARAVG